MSIKLPISVSGSRNFTDFKYLVQVLDHYRPIISSVKVGDAKGLDSMVIRYCQERQIPYQMLKADWDTYKKIDCPIRNADIIAGTSLLLAFPASDSKGTIDAMNKAYISGMTVHVYEFEKFN